MMKHVAMPDSRSEAPPVLASPAVCPLCHTVEPTLTDDSLRAGAEWTCTRCGQMWSALRLATVASYVRYTDQEPGVRHPVS